MDFDEVCRTCLRSDASSLSSLFHSKLTRFGLSPVDVIRLLTSFTTDLQISCKDEFPQQICSECLDEIERTYAFKLTCERSSVILKQIQNTRKVSTVPVLCENDNNENICTLETDTKTFQGDCSLEQSTMNICRIKSEKIETIINVDEPITNIYQIKTELLEAIGDSDQPQTKICQNETEKNETISDLDQICQIKTENYELISNDLEDQSGADSFKCLACPLKCLSLEGLRKHFIASHMTIDFCKICNKGFNDSIQDHCLQHLPIPSPNNEFPCTICSQSFNKKSDLVRHSKSHTKEKPFKCAICLKRFCDEYNLTYHMRATHPFIASKVFQCKICLKIFGIKSHLIRHAIIHTDKRPYKCDICSKDFRQKNTLMLHSRVKHVDESTIQAELQCKTCSKLFGRKSDLVRHLRSHTEEWPFKCEMCSKSFRYKYNLTRHLRDKHT